MKLEDNNKVKIALEPINQKLDSIGNKIDNKLNFIEREINKIPKNKESDKFFGTNILISFGLVLIAIAIPILLELLELPKLALWITFFSYSFLAISFILIAKKFYENK